MVKDLPALQGTQVWSLEKRMANHSSILAWRIPWTEERGGLQSIRSQRVRHDWTTSTHKTYKSVIVQVFRFCILYFFLHQFSSVVQLCPTLCNPMNRSTPGLLVHHQLPEFTQTRIHRVSDAIQPSHPLSSPSPRAPNPSQHQSLFQWVSSWHEVEFQL